MEGWRRSLWTCYLRPLLSSVTGWESEPKVLPSLLCESLELTGEASLCLKGEL